MIKEATKSSKYRNRPVFIDGIRFASQAEGKRYGELKLLARAGQISSLELQPRYPLSVNGHHICTYVGDFEYVERGKRTVEDVKGMRLDSFVIKSNYSWPSIQTSSSWRWGRERSHRNPR